MLEAAKNANPCTFEEKLRNMGNPVDLDRLVELF